MDFHDMSKGTDLIDFYGVDGYAFKLGDQVFEAVEDPSDGYRSYLGSIELAKTDGLIFFDQPLDMVTVRAVRTDDHGRHTGFDGYEMISVADGHVWLRIGTEDWDDYYPLFIFEYHPRSNK